MLWSSRATVLWVGAHSAFSRVIRNIAGQRPSGNASTSCTRGSPAKDARIRRVSSIGSSSGWMRLSSSSLHRPTRVTIRSGSVPPRTASTVATTEP